MNDRDRPDDDDLFPESDGVPPVEPIPLEPTPGIPWRLAVFLFLVVLIVIFAIQNTQDVELRFLAWSWSLPLVVVILIAVVISVVIDEVLGGLIKRRRLKRRREREELERFRRQG